MRKFSFRRTGLSRFHAEDGGALIEVALLMPVVLLMVFGVVQFGILMLKYSTACYAAQAGARYASLHSITSQSSASDALIQQVVKNNLLLDQAAWTVTTNWSSANTVGTTSSVLVSNTYNVALPFSRTKQITIGSTAQRLIVR